MLPSASICQAKGPQRNDVTGTIFNVILDDVALGHFRNLLFPFLLPSHLEGFAVNLEVTGTRTDDIESNPDLVIEKCLTDIANVSQPSFANSSTVSTSV